MNTSRGHSVVAAAISIGVTLAVLVGATWLLLNRSYVVDQLTIWQYQPSQEITQLAQDSGMSDRGAFYFYASQPVLHQEQDAFNAACPRQEKASAVLGCYAARKIHIYDIPDPRLEGVPAVTAAHEMLHAVWDRLPTEERNHIGDLLQAEYTNLQASPTNDLKERMEYYGRTSPEHIDNELFAIIATETSDISAELETHYNEYFDDRAQVVALYESYNNRFVELTRTTDTLKQELEQLSGDISAMTGQYNAGIDALNTDIYTFNARAASAYYADEATFSRDRGALVARADEMEQLRGSIDAKMREYEDKRVIYNEQVDESNSLLQSLDSTLAPAPSI